MGEGICIMTRMTASGGSDLFVSVNLAAMNMSDGELPGTVEVYFITGKGGKTETLGVMPAQLIAPLCRTDFGTGTKLLAARYGHE